MPRPLPLSASRADEVAEQFRTPLHLYDEKGIRQNVRCLLSTFDRYFPPLFGEQDDDQHDGNTPMQEDERLHATITPFQRFDPNFTARCSVRGPFKQFYAVKALPNPAVIRVLLDEGLGLDCSGLSELLLAHSLGARGERVMFTSNFTAEEELTTAFDHGVIINLDDISHLHTLVRLRGRAPALISFRLNPGVGATQSETSSNVLGGPDAKFGVPVDQIVECYQMAKRNGSRRFGIHMMSGSCVLDLEYWERAVNILLQTMNEIRTKLDISFEFINIGGGMGIPYQPHEQELNVEDMARTILKVYTRCLEGVNRLPALFMENGRYVTGPYGWLLTRVQSIKRSFGPFVGVDACMAHLMRPGMYGSYHHITVPFKEEDTERERVNVVGSLCENNDWFAKQRDLPKMCIGDLVVVHDTGAHASSMGFQYNGKLRCAEVLLRDDESRSVVLIRKHEQFQDLFRNCVDYREKENA